MDLVEEVLKVDLKQMDFMTSEIMKYQGKDLRVSRCGYTGEDGFELSIPGDIIVDFVENLRSKKDPATNDDVAKFVGLGARDTLRLEAGLCLYGHELNEDITPIEAVLAWTISKKRREDFTFLGGQKVKEHLESGIKQKRVGFIVEGPPARENTKIFSESGEEVGIITSGSHAPSLKKSIG